MPDRQSVLVVVSEDPRVSHRANEAIRIALGVAAGESPVTIVLTGPAVHLLDEDTDELVDGDDVAKYRASLKRLGVPFHVEESALPRDPTWNREGHPIVPIAADGVAGMLPRAARFLIF